jgi:rhodanese-related sulfurtransferase
MEERVAMVGAGYWAQFQLEGWRDAGAPVVALCNRSAARAAPLASRFSVPRCYTTSAQMLDNEQPTLLDVVLPPEVQEDAVRAALERGIPVICQKPFGLNLAQAEAMTALAEAAGHAAGGARELPLRALVPRKPPPDRQRLLRPRARHQLPAAPRRRPGSAGLPGAPAVLPDRCRSSWCARLRCISSTPSATCWAR